MATTDDKKKLPPGTRGKGVLRSVRSPEVEARVTGLLTRLAKSKPTERIRAIIRKTPVVLFKNLTVEKAPGLCPAWDRKIALLLQRKGNAGEAAEIFEAPIGGEAGNPSQRRADTPARRCQFACCTDFGERRKGRFAPAVRWYDAAMAAAPEKIAEFRWGADEMARWAGTGTAHRHRTIEGVRTYLQREGGTTR